MKLNKASGATIAAAAAAFMLSGATIAPVSAAEEGKVKCYGVNSCKGHGACKTASNDCKGMNSCKGKGWLAMPAKACGDVGGKPVHKAHGSIAKADLIHCHGVNACAGHNDCKTADNACKGHAKCKGTGFVATPAKACKDIGGKVG